MILGWLAIGAEPSRAQSGASRGGTNEIRIIELQGTVEISPARSTTWILTQTNQVLHSFDRVRTGPHSRVALLWSDQSVVPFGALAELEILPPHEQNALSGLHLIKGILSFFHRDTPGRIRVITRGAVAGVEGTEFVLAVDDEPAGERTTLSVIDGKVRFSNELGALSLTNGQQAVAEVGKAPARTAGFIANNLLQWCFYYPAVLDLKELPLTSEEQRILDESLAAYRSGDLLAALAKYPEGRRPGSDAGHIYHAALLLAVGQVDEAETELSAVPVNDPSEQLPRLAIAQRQLIAAVKRQPNPAAVSPKFATEFLAASYYEQSQAVLGTSLKRALNLARQATTNSPDFAFAWARLAELEFGFGRTGNALDALNRSLELAPLNAEALALKGFLLASQNRTREALAWFDLAIAADSALSDAWLGRGLARIRKGDTKGGREDLLIAAALEPQRAVLRSYLSKAYTIAGDTKDAEKEIRLAKQLDPADPTAWLYGGLEDQLDNRINEGIRDLEKSEDLNDNRRLFRSELLLDQDRAVRSANLASLYQDAGMTDVSVREASRAVSYDYGNFSSHLFLANSYDLLRDPNRINLRYETPAESEYLIANLLAPVSAGALSQTRSEDLYSKLFERDRLGVTSSTEYLSRGAWVERGAQFGTIGNTAYSFEGNYRSDPGQRPNNDFQETDLHLQFKQQLTPNDTLYLRGIYYEAEGGDVSQYYYQTNANLGLRTKETLEPLLSLGYSHEWAPGIHTLLLGNWVNDKLSVNNPTQPTLFIIKEDGVTPSYVQPITVDLNYQSKLEMYTAELQQIWQRPNNTLIFGGRFQSGDFDTELVQQNPAAGDNVVFFPPDAPAASQDIRVDFERASVYGYDYWQILPALQLVGGVAYDWIQFPENFRAPPVSSQTETTDQVSPKAGFILTPLKDTVLRFAYTRSLAGASIDQSLLLEPSQVAGFNQSFRSIIPESVGGAEAGATFETFHAALEQKFRTGTYLGITAEALKSEVTRNFGVFEYTGATDFAVPSSTRESLDFDEKTLLVTFNQLVGNQLSFGADYRLSKAELDDTFTQIPNSAFIDGLFRPRQDLTSTLQRVGLYALYNHPSGFFAQFQALWYEQSNSGYSPELPGEHFWQFNVFAGYRFPQRKAEIRLGLLNLTDQNYQLNPLTLYNELPRERTLSVSFQVSF